MATVTKLYDNTWCFDEEGVRFFLLTGTKEALLIDSGMQTKNAKELAREFTDLPIKLLNTHADTDHIASNFEFEEFYMHPAEAGNYYKEHNGTGKILPLYDKDVLDLGDRPLEIIALPGHTPGSIAVLDLNHRILFAGDVVQDSFIYMFGQRREIHAYILSLDKLLGLQTRFDAIYPSHGTLPLPNDSINKIRDSVTKVLNGEIPGRAIELYGKKVVRYDLDLGILLYD